MTTSKETDFVHDSAIVGILKTIHEMQNVPQTRAIGFVIPENNKP